jgi:hypothetical protein
MGKKTYELVIVGAGIQGPRRHALAEPAFAKPGLHTARLLADQIGGAKPEIAVVPHLASRRDQEYAHG